jgi:hypothetical protein
MAVSSISFMALDVVKVMLIKNWSFELTAKLWPSNKNKEKLKTRQERASLLERVDNNVSKLRKAVLMSTAVAAFRRGASYVKNASRSVMNLSSLETRRQSVEVASRQPSMTKLDDGHASKSDAVTIASLQKSNLLSETEDVEAEQSPSNDSNQ